MRYFQSNKRAIRTEPIFGINTDLFLCSYPIFCPLRLQEDHGTHFRRFHGLLFFGSPRKLRLRWREETVWAGGPGKMIVQRRLKIKENFRNRGDKKLKFL